MMKTKKRFGRCKALGVAVVAAALVVSGTLPRTRFFGAFAEEAAKDNDYCYQEGYNTCVNIEAEGAVLLKNKNNCLPLAEQTKVTLLGSMAYNYVQGGTGSAGGNDDENTVMMNDAFAEAGLDVNATAWSWLKNQCGGKRNKDDTDPAKVGWTSYTKIHEFPVTTYNAGKDSILQSGYTDYAIVTFSRSGAEGASPSMDYDGDGSTLTGSTYLELNQDEKDLLQFCKENFKHTIVLVNSAAAMELGFIDSTAYNVDACLWIGHPGEAGIVGVGTVLTGRSNPSGALVDTYGYDMTTNPTYYNTDDNRYTNGQTFYQYEEGIYVGYRYYETADSVGYFDSDAFKAIEFKNGKASGYDEVVQFPFGYGLSYTTFTQTIKSSDVSLKAHGTNSVTVTVENTGSVAGKEIVQLYMDAPYHQDGSLGISGKGLEKSKVVLVGYAKTDEIEAGKTQDITIEFKTDDLASFDNFGQGCYVLEKGEYHFNLQDNAHCWSQTSTDDNAVYASKAVTLDSTIVYNDDGAGKRDSDASVAANAMDDVTAGDGNMLDGYLSRSDIAGGMAAIMKHTSNEKANEVLNEEMEKCLNLRGTESYTYTYQTYVKGVKKTLTSTIYAHGNNMMPFAEYTPEGVATATMEKPKWGQTYYVKEDADGKVITDDNGYFEVLTEAPADGSKYHKLCCEDMVTVPITTEKGKAIWDKLVEETTLAEAIEIQGNSGWQISAVESVGKQSQKTVDGPGEVANGTMAGATWFPCAVAIAATWNNDLARAEGVAYGNQAVLFGVGAGYAPAMNIHRSPFGGRNFEYYSEDGFLSGNIGGSAVAGIQSTGTGVLIKHFALNDGDTNRGGNTTWANEQAIREIYLRTYEIACKEYKANGIMGSLNRIGMSWFHYGMYTTVLRHEWGWEGFLITDGDGADGDVYNSAQAMLSIEGAMLSRGCYINAPSTVAAYGDATSYTYGQVALHNTMRHCLFQYCGNGSIGVTQDSTDNSALIIGCVVGGVAAAVVIAGVIVGVNVAKKKKAKKA